MHEIKNVMCNKLIIPNNNDNNDDKTIKEKKNSALENVSAVESNHTEDQVEVPENSLL